jgi:hypothetical protein
MEVANQEYKPRLEKLKNFYSHLKNKQVKKRNFYGCMVEKKDEKNLIIYPEKNISHKGSARGKTLRTILKNIF